MQDKKVSQIFQERLRYYPALVLDRDGTIIESVSGKDFPDSLEDIKLVDGIERMIHHYKENGYLVFVVTNQGGVAFKYKTIFELHEENRYMLSLFKVAPFRLPDIKFAIRHPDPGAGNLSGHTLLRKPWIGMLGAIEWESQSRLKIIKWENSLIVGDRQEDEQLAAQAQVPFMWVHDFVKQNIPEPKALVDASK